jgi:hypothetical protein
VLENMRQTPADKRGRGSGGQEAGRSMKQRQQHDVRMMGAR